jgi:hypothetical protein
MIPVTPAIATLAGATGGNFYLVGETTAEELY